MSASGPGLNESRAYDGETFGEAVAMDRERSFALDSRGYADTKTGAVMVADELLRALLTRPGSDPIRPEFGLDLRAVLSRADGPDGRSSIAEAAIHDVIGPRADPRVERIDDISFERDPGNRVVAIDVKLTLDDTDQTPIRLRAGFESRLGRDTTAEGRERASREAGVGQQ